MDRGLLFSASGGDTVSGDIVAKLDFADALSVVDTNGLLVSADTVAGVTTIVLEHPSTGAMDRIDNGGVYWTFPLTDRLGTELKRSLHMATVMHGLLPSVLPVAGDSNLAFGIGVRISGTTTWYAGGVAYNASTRYNYNAGNGSSAVSIAVPNAERFVGISNLAGPVFVNGMNFLYTTGSDYNRLIDRTIQNESDLTTKAELIVTAGFRGTPGTAGEHTFAGTFWWVKPWAWANRGDVL
jgi:hypothetical protein